MPQLSFHGVDIEKVQAISSALVATLADAMDTTEDNFILEVNPSVQVQAGAIVTPYPFVEVRWFTRGQAIQDASAQVITHALQQQGYAEVEVFFLPLSEAAYYYQGKHFADA